MFRGLKYKLTFINVAVVAVITVIFMASVFALTVKGIYQQADQVMRLIAGDAGSDTASYITRRERHWFDSFYIKLNKNGKLTETSEKLPLSQAELHQLVQKTLATPGQKGVVKNGKRHDGHYRFLKAPLNNGAGVTLVFLNTASEEKIIDHLIGALAATGLGSIALTLFASLFMANRALIPIKKSWQRQKDFVADASHELRTPLAVIQTSLDIVRSNPAETVQSQAGWLANIDAESKLMAKLVEDLLFLARADSQQQMVHMEYFPLHTVIYEAAKSFAPLAAEKNINLKTRINTNSYFYGDPGRIKQLTAILLDNALKYTPPGGEVILQLTGRNNVMELSVADTGEGIAKEHQDKIFERFYRVDKVRSRQDGGTGLGLAIAAWIVKEHHGTIKVISSPGAGTTFVLSLPQASSGVSAKHR